MIIDIGGHLTTVFPIRHARCPTLPMRFPRLHTCTRPEAPMSIVTLELPLSEPTLVVVPWHDDVIDRVGYNPRSTYVEFFWLNVLGPTTTWLVRRISWISSA